MACTLRNFADNIKHGRAVSMLEGSTAIPMDYKRLEKGLTEISRVQQQRMRSHAPGRE